MRQHQVHQQIVDKLERLKSNIQLDKDLQDLRATDEWRVMADILNREIQSRTESLIYSDMDEAELREARSEVRMLQLILGIRRSGEASVTKWISEANRLQQMILRRETMGLHRDPTGQRTENGA